MTIQVVSTSEPQPETQKVEAVGQPDEGTQSAPEAVKASEQNDEVDSEPTEREIETKDESEDAEEGSDESKDTEQDKPKKKGGFQRRIDKLNARNADAQREAEYWKKLALEKEAAAEPKKADPKVESQAAPDEEPNPELFESHAEYVKALTTWALDHRDKTRAEQEQRAKIQDEQQRLVQEHHAREKSFADKTDDYAEVVNELLGSNPHISAAFEEAVVTSEVGPELMYELAKNRAEFERINKLPPLAAARAIGKLEAKISEAQESKKPELKKTTKAPTPIAPVGSKGGHVEKSIYDPNLTQQEYERLRAKQRSAY